MAFVGSVIDPTLFEEAWKERFDDALYSYAIELGRLLYRNPEMPIKFASGYLAAQYSQEFQEALLQFQKEKDEEFFALLAEIGGYTMALRRWNIVNSIDEVQINVIGQVQGELKDNVEVYDNIATIDEVSKFIGKSKISLLSQPPFLPSGLGITPFYSVAMGTLTMIEDKLATRSFFEANKEIITYHPMDILEIESKLVYYLEENPEEREQIAKAGKDRAFKEHTLYQRGEILGNILENIIQQAVPQDDGKVEG